MTFVLIGLLFTGGCAALFRRLGVPYAYSKGLFMAISLSLLAVICLAQNYTQNLIQDPRVNDGISITNHIAYWINGGDNWSIHSFKLSFQQSIYVTLFLLAAIHSSSCSTANGTR